MVTPRKMTNEEALAKARKSLPRDRTRRDEGGLTDKERAFVLHYLGAAAGNGTQAAMLAGYSKGTRAACRSQAHQVLQRPNVVAEIERLRSERNERLRITAEDVLHKLLVIEAEATLLGRNAPALKLRRDVVKDIGDHVDVGAFRKQVGLSNPTGGPIETVDHAALAQMSDEELDQLERARAILDRVGTRATLSNGGGNQGGEGAASEGA